MKPLDEIRDELVDTDLGITCSYCCTHLQNEDTESLIARAFDASTRIHQEKIEKLAEAIRTIAKKKTSEDHGIIGQAKNTIELADAIVISRTALKDIRGEDESK